MELLDIRTRLQGVESESAGKCVLLAGRWGWVYTGMQVCSLGVVSKLKTANNGACRNTGGVVRCVDLGASGAHLCGRGWGETNRFRRECVREGDLLSSFAFCLRSDCSRSSRSSRFIRGIDCFRHWREQQGNPSALPPQPLRAAMTYR